MAEDPCWVVAKDLYGVVAEDPRGVVPEKMWADLFSDG